MNPPVIYDLRGLKCPLPVLKTRRRLSTMEKGGRLAIETTDPMAVIDIPHLCTEDGHDLIESATTESGHRFVIRKG
ncbi:sulfurtransferase TusA family protein [Rhizobiaceae bacterium n13]|uniref:Sulfurtransferase TusA family protein n=1 Tax=Ferirhizobium litorale TaxID=2927786 RepID=A0AAE3QEH4_9HYPH|nr:sulfurtransferase TusA family protein [Fererhizobium litorale]MDI7862576.1 sulfurtransferase TusA family protein [Fererhizobium litorale]MDI7923590.1 sulfurtransferase TusA family protein [Fererhizobium litorale]